MSTAVPPFVVNSSGGDSDIVLAAASRDLTGSRLFQYYMESFFKIPKDIKNDIIYCQRALKAHIKVHQMVLDVFQQQPDADPQQKKRIIDELESEIYEINAEQNFLLLRLRRVIDQFYKMLKKNGIPTDVSATNAMVSSEIVPLISDTSVEIIPITVTYRSSEEKLIEKYFEVQKDPQSEVMTTVVSPPPSPSQLRKKEPANCVEIINLDDDGNILEQIVKTQQQRGQRGQKREYPNSGGSVIGTANTNNNGESLLKKFEMAVTCANASQTSLLKPMNQRVINETVVTPIPVVMPDIKSKMDKGTTLAEIYNQRRQEKEEEQPVSTNVKMSRMNLRQALKRAQAAVRGPAAAVAAAAPLPPPPPPPPQPIAVVPTKPPATKGRPSKASIAAAAAAAAAAAKLRKSPEVSSSSEEGTPERGPTPPHAYWPDELEETRTKAEEYGQEMFLRIFDLYTPEVYAHMQQRRSKRRRRCVQNNSYHYGASGTNYHEPETKKKRKAFLLSPQVKKAIPNKRNKRRSADNASDINSAPPSRSASSSPQDDKRTCNECFKGGYILEQCEQCKSHYHPQCQREEDAPTTQDPKEILSQTKICPTCKRSNDKLLQKEILLNKELQNTAHALELKLAQEKDRREVLQRTGKMYKIQMNSLFKIVDSLKSDNTHGNVTTKSTRSTGHII
ncbi:l(3)mbt interacting protein 1 [Musca autumnalis]|uniref:l(3)mbt interacting protein 1 n=1 Tax=Musca autumnalis TaxID=221902 RepID=UPI003CED62A0